MNKKAIKTFAVEARKKLIDEIKYRASLLGITEEGISDPVEKIDGMEVYDVGGTPYKIYDEAIEQRKSLVKRINEKGFDNVIEEVAYTWFNRIIAIRFMEVNDYLPGHVRVLSSEKEGKIEPDIVTMAPDVDLDFSDEEIETVYRLKDENRLDELFRMLFIKQCNKLNEILPELFEETADYTEILLSISYTSEDGVVRRLVDLIPEEDFRDQVEIIGWMYQYYISEVKDETFAKAKKNVKISKERIPAATQLFTPRWIVKYMVENSLGRLWIEGHPESEIKRNWKYYLEEAEQEPEVQAELEKIRQEYRNLKPEDIRVIDPAMGSGHILVYVFDVLMQIYTSMGYSERDAAVSILENNIYGLDIDDRAYQLAYFAVMMKARSYNRRILKMGIEPHLCSIQESNGITDELIDFVASGNEQIKRDLIYLREVFIDAKEYGSLIDVDKIDFDSILERLAEIRKTRYSDFDSIRKQEELFDLLNPIIKQSIILSEKYDVVITNPPYLGSKNMNKKLKDYLRKRFPDTKSDLFAAFIEKCLSLMGENRYIAMITQHSFMFLSAYKNLRERLLDCTIINMAHLGARAFDEIGGEVVQTTSFVSANFCLDEYKSAYMRLVSFKSQISKQNGFLRKENEYFAKKKDFLDIPGHPFSYWISDNVRKIFKVGIPLKNIAKPALGVSTHKDDYFLKLWYEVNSNKIGFGIKDRFLALNSKKKWFPYNKGGNYRKWYGNNEYVINYEKDGYELKNFKRAQISNEHRYFQKGMTWSRISTSNFSVRYHGNGYIVGDAGPSVFAPPEKFFYILGLLNTPIVQTVLNAINPTFNYQTGNISEIPVIFKENSQINFLVKENIKLSKEEWDSFEKSWNFKCHPFFMFKTSLIEESFEKWDELTQKRFSKLKSNEERLNEIFIKIYGLEDELTLEVSDSEVSIRKADLSRDIRSFISYAVGCMFGRYSLDEEGLIFAGGEWDPSRYSKFIPDEDNIIPILDTEYFEDDIVGRFIEFVRVTFGEDNLEENLDFIAKALGKRGKTSREIIRNYFMSEFYKDHVKTYKKRPIYWQFDSGKKNAFKALIYMHRYEPELVARVRTDYLHRTQKAIENRIKQNERIIENSKTKSEISRLTKENKKLIEQLEEIKVYDEALAHIANRKIEIDLDDGVQVNYAKFQGVEIKRNGKTVKVDLLKKL
ncbi:BREX-1 system adenine-specific DNA-methyltransferase PglX [Methanothermobacter sp. THM-1]|nr:BREX-1 system adenine-specific DNA-methyltransferase PglX [Methanothermobacter sp. THM-1]QHN06696.1 BREX-1 system adenine-specific DNA-methyltransferase PglX [Methanothermobacter sp. THM-1]